MTRKLVLYCTGRGIHERVDLMSWSLPDGIKPSEFVRWSPVSEGETLTLGPCNAVLPDGAKCSYSPDLGHDLGSRLIGELERQSRTLGCVEFDLSSAGI